MLITVSWIKADGSVADPDPEPEGSETFGRIRIRFGSEINISDPDSNPDPKPDPKQIYKKETYIHAIMHNLKSIKILIEISLNLKTTYNFFRTYTAK